MNGQEFATLVYLLTPAKMLHRNQYFLGLLVNKALRLTEYSSMYSCGCSLSYYTSYMHQ